MRAVSKKSGRISIVALLGLVGAIVVIVLLFFSGESAQTAGTRFMSALASRDAKTLADLSYVQGRESSDLVKEWETAVNETGKYYRFAFAVTSSAQADDRTASVRMQVLRNVDRPSSYEEKFELPMIRVSGRWMVDLRSLDRRIFPNLPRG